MGQFRSPVKIKVRARSPALSLYILIVQVICQNLFRITISCRIALGLLLIPTQARGEENGTQNSTHKAAIEEKTKTNNSHQFDIFPVGIIINGRTINTSALVKGAEDGARAINFQEWLIPFDLVVETLNITVTPLDNGKLELRSTGIVTRINPQKLITDDDLGLVLSIAQIKKILNVTAKFDLSEYAIAFAPPSLNIKPGEEVAELPIITEGLPKINPARFTFTTVGQRFRVNNRDLDSQDFDSQNELKAIGTAFGGSWYARVNQAELFDVGTWQFGELQYLRQTDAIDYALGSQSSFWQSPSDGQYWGITTIQRFGFTPDRDRLSLGGFNPNLRRQPQAVNRSVAGIAQPGDVVHLVTRRRQEIVQEIVVDEAGTYQFENVDYRNNDYEILIYPNGRLTATPEIKEPLSTYVSGQLSKGTSTIATSLGTKRNLSTESFWGDFAHITGGVNYRRGITEELTLGTGLVVDRSLFALGELFYQPTNVPLKLGISTLVNPELSAADYRAYFNYQPTDKFNFNFNFNGTASGHSLHLNWRPKNNLSLHLGNNNQDDITTGFTFSKSGRFSKAKISNYQLLTSLDYGNNQGLSQRLDARYNAWQLAHQGNRSETFSRLSRSLSNDSYNPRGQGIFAGYDTRNAPNSNSVVNLGWHYSSGQNASDGGSLWDVELGYGFNSQGSAPLAALTTRAIPGTTVRFSYQGISPVNEDSRLRIDIFPNLRLQGRPSLGDRDLRKLRTQGGLLVRPFADLNTNGKLDPGEKIYTEDTELLLSINHKSLDSIPHEITQRGVYVRLAADKYRLDLDPVGYPLNFKPTESSYGVRVVTGSYTKLDISLNPSYTAIGIITDSQDQPVAGAKVQAIPRQGKGTILSITNSAGVYFLEGLAQDTYSLTVNDRPVNLKSLQITPDSEPLQEINLQLPSNSKDI